MSRHLFAWMQLWLCPTSYNLRYTAGTTVVLPCVSLYSASFQFHSFSVWCRRSCCICQDCLVAPLGSLQILQFTKRVPVSRNEAFFLFEYATSATKEETNQLLPGSKRKPKIGLLYFLQQYNPHHTGVTT